MVLLNLSSFVNLPPKCLVSNYSKQKRKRRNPYLLTEKHIPKSGKFLLSFVENIFISFSFHQESNQLYKLGFKSKQIKKKISFSPHRTDFTDCKKIKLQVISNLMLLLNFKIYFAKKESLFSLLASGLSLLYNKGRPDDQKENVTCVQISLCRYFYVFPLFLNSHKIEEVSKRKQRFCLGLIFQNNVQWVFLGFVFN